MKTITCFKALFYFSLLLIGANIVVVQGASKTGYEPAFPIKRGQPIFPKSDLRKGDSGMAEIEMMIDPNGKVFAPVALRSTSVNFERAALDAVKKYDYKPAYFDGEPVESRTSIRINFSIYEEKDAVSRRFASHYKKAMTELAKPFPELEKIKNIMRKMKSSGGLTLYALARYNLVSMRSAMVFGDLDQQIEATRNLLLFDQGVDDESRMLDAELLVTVRRSLFASLLKTQRYAEALMLFKVIEKEDSVTASTLAGTVAKLAQLKDDDSHVSVNIALGERGYALEHLFKRNLSLFDVEGEIKALKFRCSHRFQEFLFKVDSEYQIPNSWGSCLVEVVGQPGSIAKLVQR